MSEKRSSTFLPPILRWFMLAMVLANIAGAMYPMMLPIYLTKLGASVSQVGMFFFLSSTVLFVLQIFGGWVSDSIGRLRSIAIGSLGGIIGLSGMAMAPTWQWMLVAHTVTMIPYALVNPSSSAFIAENSSEENRGRVYGITDTLYHIMGILGPPLGGFLVGSYGFRTMLCTATGIYTAAAGLRIWMATTMSTQEKQRDRDLSWNSLKGSLTTMLTMLTGGGVITWIFLTDGIRDTAFRMTRELEPLYLEQIGGLSVEQIGLLGSLFSVAMMVVPLLSGRIADRTQERVPISLGFLLTAIAMVIFLFSRAFFGFAATWVIYGIGVGLLSPAYQSLISKVVPKENLGVFTGLFRSSIGLISLPAPWLGAHLWERFNPRFPFAITAAAAFLAILPGWFKFKQEKKDKSTARTNR
ncbi:MAG: MFS transporter [Anaerolineales bacterium]|nr:MFS transporter [Anaerolineales bacterium]MBS3753467.1 MFS transporter [Anaerolineales bacterium]